MHCVLWRRLDREIVLRNNTKIENVATYILLIERKKSVRVRDTFAGKIISETREVKTISEK